MTKDVFNGCSFLACRAFIDVLLRLNALMVRDILVIVLERYLFARFSGLSFKRTIPSHLRSMSLKLKVVPFDLHTNFQISTLDLMLTLIIVIVLAIVFKIVVRCFIFTENVSDSV